MLLQPRTSIAEIVFWFTFVTLLSACQVDTTKDSVQKSRDRDREMSKALEADYALVSGDYESTDDNPSEYWLHFRLTVVKDLRLQPSLSGVVFFLEKGRLRAQENPLSRPEKDWLQAPISQGVYDPPSRSLILTLSGLGDGVAAITVNCDMRDLNRIPCLWKPATMMPPFDFVLRKVQ